jgi:hypothetical protein
MNRIIRYTNHQFLHICIEFINKTLCRGKEGDIQYAIQGIVGELAELMKELDPTIPPDNI